MVVVTVQTNWLVIVGSGLLVLLSAANSLAAPVERVALIVNTRSAISRRISEYYARQRGIPRNQFCTVAVSSDEVIDRVDYEDKIAKPVGRCLATKQLIDQVYYLVTTSGVPLRIRDEKDGKTSLPAVDSALTLLYADLKKLPRPPSGPVPNPFFAKTGEAFAHPRHPIYLVTRLTGYDFADVKGIIDRALLARNTGKFVLDLYSSDNVQGNDWLRDAARQLPKERVVLEESAKVVTNETRVIGFASWGSNDKNRKQRVLGFQWLPGAIMTEYVSTNGRTFTRPPDSWTLGTWPDARTWFHGAPQTLTADYLHEGVTGASGHTDEPFLTMTPRPDYLLPAYYRGRNLAESYYLSIPALAWMNIVVGDPLCVLSPP